jgi:orotate phosphoribosyltransferase
MQDDVLSLFAARKGHFRFESGHHGDLWLDIPPAYLNPRRLRDYARELARKLSAHAADAVCGPLVEGAFLAQMIAEELELQFFFAEQFVRPRADGLFPIGYRIPDSLRAVVAGRKVAVVDDVINAGSAVRGAMEDLVACGAQPVAIGTLLTLGAPASELATSKGVALQTLSRLPGNNLWAPAACPLCASGTQLDSTE